MKTIEDLIEFSGNPASLIRTVVERLGGWEEFTRRAPDIVNWGAGGRFSGFTAHSMDEYILEEASYAYTRMIDADLARGLT